MSYKVGETVRIVSEDYMRLKFTPQEEIDCFRTPGGLYINKLMLRYCGEEVEIRSVDSYFGEARYSVAGDSWLWDDYCFEEVKQFDFSGLEELL